MNFLAPFYRGLLDDRGALDLLKRSSVLKGVELTHGGSDVARFQDIGIPVSYHTPGHEFLGNLGDPDPVSYTHLTLPTNREV